MSDDENLKKQNVEKPLKSKKLIQEHDDGRWYYLSKIPLVIPFVIPLAPKKKK